MLIPRGNDTCPFSSLLTTFFSVKAPLLSHEILLFYIFCVVYRAVISYTPDTAKLHVTAADHSGHLSTVRSLFQAKLETKALKAKRPGFTDERYNETSYYVEHGQYLLSDSFVFNPATAQGRRSRLIVRISWRINASLRVIFVSNRDLRDRERSFARV